MPNIDWYTLDGFNSKTEENLCLLMVKYDISQLNTFPSRITSPNLLDVIFTNIDNIECVDSIIESDHLQLNFNIRLPSVDESEKSRKAYNWKRANMTKLKSDLVDFNMESSIDELVKNNVPIDRVWLHWRDNLLETIHRSGGPIGGRYDVMTS